MKKLILPLVAFVCLSLNSFAQTGACNVHTFTIELVSSAPSHSDPTKTDLRLDLSWDVSINSGSAATYFHIWQENAYTAIDYSKTSKPPKAADLVTTLGTIAIKDPATSPTIINAYAPDASYTKLLGVGKTVKKIMMGNGIERYIIKDLLIPNVSGRKDKSFGFKGDIWSSQSGSNIHCAAIGKSFVVNEVASRSMFRCMDAGKTKVSIVSTQPSAAGTYQLYVDNTTPGTLDPTSDALIGGQQQFATGNTATLAGDFPYEFAASEVTIPSEYNGKVIWLVVTPTGKSSQLFSINNTCTPLPVTFGTFTAARKGQSVFVSWETRMELNVSGFNVQRLTSGNWVTVAFVPAKNLANGSSYELTDVNAYKGLSQYRIVSVDMDGKQKLSEIRSVRGEESNSRVSMYPNPTTTGSVNLVFDNSSSRDISVVDVTGRVVKQLQNQRGSNVRLDLVQDGLYQIQVMDRTTGERIVEKVIVKKR